MIILLSNLARDKDKDKDKEERIRNLTFSCFESVKNKTMAAKGAIRKRYFAVKTINCSTDLG